MSSAQEPVRLLHSTFHVHLQSNPSETERNDKTIICQYCTSVVILPNVGQWSNKTVELPLARQQKGIDTQKVLIFFMIYLPCFRKRYQDFGQLGI